MRSLLLIALVLCMATFSSAAVTWGYGACADATCTQCYWALRYPTQSCLTANYPNATWTNPTVFTCDFTLNQINRTRYALADTACTGNYTLFPFPGFPQTLTPVSTACQGANTVDYECFNAASSIQVSAVVMAVLAVLAVAANKLF